MYSVSLSSRFDPIRLTRLFSTTPFVHWKSAFHVGSRWSLLCFNWRRWSSAVGWTCRLDSTRRTAKRVRWPMRTWKCRWLCTRLIFYYLLISSSDRISGKRNERANLTKTNEKRRKKPRKTTSNKKKKKIFSIFNLPLQLKQCLIELGNPRQRQSSNVSCAGEWSMFSSLVAFFSFSYSVI